MLLHPSPLTWSAASRDQMKRGTPSAASVLRVVTVHRVERVRYPAGLPQVTYPVGLRLMGFLVLYVTPPLLRVLRVRRYTTLRVVLCRDRGELGMLRMR